jgi:hypothetical protein
VGMSYQPIEIAEIELARVIKMRGESISKSGRHSPELDEAIASIAAVIAKAEAETNARRIADMAADLPPDCLPGLEPMMTNPALDRKDRDSILRTFEETAAGHRRAERIRAAMARSTIALQGGTA